MFKKLLMVCAGNICRSPMAEALLASRLSSRGVKVVVESAGVAAPEGAPADPMAVALLRERGLDISGHRARRLAADLLPGFELVLVMDEGLRRAVEREHPAARGRVQLLGRFGKFEIADPYRKPREEFERALELIDRGVREYENAFWGQAR